jgi:hypothetical protein
LRPSLDDLLSSAAADVEEDEDEEDEVAKGGKVIKFGWMDGVLMKCLVSILCKSFSDEKFSYKFLSFTFGRNLIQKKKQ